MHLVMFDIDGTLVDSDEFDGILYAQAIWEVLDVKIDGAWDSYRNVTDGGILDELLAAVGDEEQRAELQALVKKRFVRLTEEYISRNAIQEIPGAQALLDRLISSSEVQVAVATGGWKETAELKLMAIGIDPFAVPLATSSDALSRTEIIKVAEQRSMARAPFKRKSYFGDGAWDKRASEELGYRFFGVGSGIEHDIVFADLRDQDAILKELAA